MNEFEQEIINSTDRFEVSDPTPPRSETSKTDLLVWWTNEQECHALTEISPLWSDYDATLEGVPDYIHGEFCSRWGRNGRGRLWVSDDFGPVGIPWDTTKPASRLAGERGGIVIYKRDAVHVFGLPGFLTDLRLNVINTLEAQP